MKLQYVSRPSFTYSKVANAKQFIIATYIKVYQAKLYDVYTYVTHSVLVYKNQTSVIAIRVSHIEPIDIVLLGKVLSRYLAAGS